MPLPVLALVAVAAAVAVVASSSSSRSTTGPKANPPAAPLTSSDALGAYMARVLKEKAALDDAAAANEADAAQRVSDIKSIAKYIPILGTTWTSLVDLGAWFGKVLGGAYGEENAPEDIAHLGDEAARYLEAGWIPPNPAAYFTGKVGAKSLANGMQYYRQAAEDLSSKRWPSTSFYSDDGMSTAALRALGALTLKWGADPRAAAAIEAVSKGGGTIYAANPGIADLIGTVIALETGGDVEELVSKARASWRAEDLAASSASSASTGYKPAPNPNPLPNETGSYSPPFPGAFQSLGTTADVFVRTLREAGSPSTLITVVGGKPCCAACAKSGTRDGAPLTR